MDANAVGREYPDGFGYKRLGFLQGQSIGTVGDTVISVQEGNKYIVRQVTLSNFSAAATGANVGVHTSTAATGSDVADSQLLTGASCTASYASRTAVSVASSKRSSWAKADSIARTVGHDS